MKLTDEEIDALNMALVIISEYADEYNLSKSLSWVYDTINEMLQQE